MDQAAYSARALMTWLQERLQGSADAVFRTLYHNNECLTAAYIAGISDEESVRTQVIEPFLRTFDQAWFQNYLRNVAEYVSDWPQEELLHRMLRGGALLFAGETDVFLIHCPKKPNVNVSKTSIEASTLGPQNGFSEDRNTNLSIIRNRYANEALQVAEVLLPGTALASAVLIYDSRYASGQVLEAVKANLARLKPREFQSEGDITRALSEKRTLFPVVIQSERPDRAVSALAAGKVLIVLDGTSFVFIVPSIMSEYMTAMEDAYQLNVVRRFVLLLRYFGLTLSLVLPSLYVSVTSYAPEIPRIQLALSIAGSRASVPYPSYLEVLFMLLMMELLTEASVRLPKTIGSTATTVGGLILGQAASQAGLVSDIMIILVAAVAISNYVIPIQAFSFSIRLCKYVLLMFTIIGGVIGFVSSLMLLIAHLSQMESYGERYVKFSKNQGYAVGKR